jgi:hypothetical protein
MEIIARAAVFGVRLSVNENNGRLHAEGRGSAPRPLMDQVRALRDQLVLELTKGAQARLDLARERQRPFLEAVEDRRPPDVTDDRWREALDGLWVFVAAGYGAEAERLGWPRDELYRVPKLWSQIWLCGAGLLIGDATVTSVTPTEIRIRPAGGAAQTFRRKPTPDLHLVHSEQLQLRRCENAADDEEARLRAREFTINFHRDCTGCDLETAKQAVMMALGQTTAGTTP